MDKIIAIAYGREASFFETAISLWKERYPLAFGWRLVVFTFGDRGQEEDYIISGDEVKIKPSVQLLDLINSDKTRFELSGKWSKFELAHFIYRRIRFARYLLDAYPRQMVVYFVTATSVINIANLDSIIESLFPSPFLASQFMTYTTINGEHRFPSGSGFLTCRRGVEEFARQSNIESIYDDVWTGRILKGFREVRFPRFDLIHPLPNLSDSIHLYLDRIERAFQEGLWHARIKLDDNRLHQEHLNFQYNLLKGAHILSASILSKSFCSERLVS
jgi:hypothetical protein